MAEVEPRAIPIESIGQTARIVQRNALAITGFYRLYISKGEQVTEANHSAVDGLAECFQSGGRAAVDACVAIIRRRLVDSGYPEAEVNAWITEVSAPTTTW